MLVSTKGRYAVRIMMDIAQSGDGSAVRIADISARQGISAKYAEQITGVLAKSGLLRSVRGTGGGYLLVKKAREYRLSEIIYKTEGDLAPAVCLNEDEAGENGRAIARFWNGLYEVMNGYLEGVTLQDLLDWSVGGDDYSI